MNIKQCENYKWGKNCDAWFLLKSDSLCILQEKMPSNTSEEKHYHNHAAQFFYILSGTALFELHNEIIEIKEKEFIQIQALTPHKIMNPFDHDLIFLLVSAPNAHGDRINV